MAYFSFLEKLDLEKAKKWLKSKSFKFPNNGTFLEYICMGFLFQLKRFYEQAKKVYGLSVLLHFETEAKLGVNVRGIMEKHTLIN